MSPRLLAAKSRQQYRISFLRALGVSWFLGNYVIVLFVVYTMGINGAGITGITGI